MAYVDIDIRDVAWINNLQTITKYGPEIYCTCPHCGKPNLSYTRKKGDIENSWKCMSCDEGGGAVKLHIWCNTTPDEWSCIISDSDRLKKEKKKAVKDILKCLESPENAKKHNELENTELNIKQADPADDKRKSDGLYAFLAELRGLKRRHYDDLFKRGLTSSQIYSLGFKSLPEKKIRMNGNVTIIPDKEEISRICQKLTNDGVNLSGIPGFFIEENGKWMFKGGVGYLCPVYDTTKCTRTERPLLLGFQIRRDEPEGVKPHGWMKYVWFSSSGKEMGTSSGAPSIFLKGRGESVIITEGILKASVSYELLGGECSLIGVPGVNSTSGLLRYFPSVRDKVVYEAFDMDKADPNNVKKMKIIQKAVLKLQELCKDNEIQIHPLEWDVSKTGWKGRFKGIDDMLCFGDNATRFKEWLNKRSKALKERKQSYL